MPAFQAAHTTGVGRSEVSLQDNLSAIVQDLQSTNSKDKRKCMETLNQFLSEVVERGVCPMEALGQHVCSNLMGLAIQHFVTPQLMKRMSNTSAARTDITKPFYQLLELLHHHIPPSLKHQPLLYKHAKPLHTLVKHIAEVLEGATTGLVCGHDYASMIIMILRIDVYRANITRRAVLELITKLSDLVQSALDERRLGAATGRGGALGDAALEQIAAALASLCGCPHLASNLQDPTDRMKRMIEMTLVCHANVAVSSSLKVEMHLVTAIRRCVEATQYDFKTSCATQRTKLLRVLLSTWHLASRRDGWKLETVQYATLQLSLVFSELLHHLSYHELSDVSSASMHAADNESIYDAEACPTALMSAVDELHSCVLPALLSILSAPKCEFSIVNSRELSHAPCAPLQPLFDFASLVLCLAQRTYRWYRQAHTQEDANRDHSDGPAEEGGMPLQKKRRAEASPIEDILTHLRVLTQDPTASTFRRDVCCVWLHTLSCPLVLSCFTESDISRIVEALMEFGQLGGCVEQPLLTALAVSAPRASSSVQETVYQWAVSKYIPSTGIDVDDGAPVPQAYELLSRLVAYVAIAKLPMAIKSSHCRSAPAESIEDTKSIASQYLLTAVQCRSYHFSTALASNAQFEVCMPLIRFRTRICLLTFLMSTLCHHHVEAPEAVQYASVIQFILATVACNALTNAQCSEVMDLLQDLTKVDELQQLSQLRHQGSGTSLSEERMASNLDGLLRTLRNERHVWVGYVPLVVRNACLPDGLLSMRSLSDSSAASTQPSSVHAKLPTLEDPATRASVRALSVAALQVVHTLADRDVAASPPKGQCNPQLASDSSRRASTLPSSGFVVSCFQTVEVLLHLRAQGYWSCPEADADGTILAELISTHRGVSDVQTNNQVKQKLSPPGVILFSIQRILELAAARFAKAEPLLVGLEPEDVGALFRMLERCGKDLFSIDVGMWEPSQRILACLGLMGRKLLEAINGFGAACGGGSAQENVHSRQASTTSHHHAVFLEDGVHVQVAMFREVTRTVWLFYVVLRATDICLSATDPLINAQHAITTVSSLLQAPHLQLLGGSGGSNSTGGSTPDAGAALLLMKPSIGTLVVLESVESLLAILSALSSEEGHLRVLEAARTMFDRHPHSHAFDVLQVLATLGDPLVCPGWAHTTRNEVGTLCQKIVTMLREQDRDTALTIAHLPPLHLGLHVAMVRCIAQVLGRCESAQAERLAKLFFEFSGVNSTFALRLATARWVSVPFATFTRVGSVLQELQYNSHQTVLSKERATSATALLALCNACAAAPQLQPDVISFMLEFYATRDFLHKPLILQAIQRLAVADHLRLPASGSAVLPEGNSLSDTVDTSVVPLYAQLTRQHALRLLYDWVWRLGHPLEAFPVVCLGYDTLPSLAEDAVGLMLPVALLHLQGGVDRSSSNAVAAILSIFSPSGDSSSLLRQHFSETVSILMLFREAKAAVPCTRPHQELAEAAAYALEWVAMQLGRELYQDLCRRYAETIIIFMLQRVGHGHGVSLMQCGQGSVVSPLHTSTACDLPSMSFTIATKALTHLCSVLGFGSIRQFFQVHQGDRAYQMLWYLYFDYAAASSPTRQCDVLLVLEQVLGGWLSDTVVLPHVLEASLHILCNMLSASHRHGVGGTSESVHVLGTIPSPGARQLLCNVLRGVWTRLRGSAQHRELLRPHTPLVSSTLLSLKNQFVEVGRLWTDLCAEDQDLRHGDWTHQQTQFRASLSQEDIGDDEEAAAGGGGGSTDHGATPEACDALLRVLGDISVLSGTPTATFYHDLAEALERQAHVFVVLTQRDPTRASTATHVTAQHLLGVAAMPGEFNVMDVRIAALSALRALYIAVLTARKYMPPSAKERIAAIPSAKLLLEPSLLLRGHNHHRSDESTSTFNLEQSFLSGMPHDEILDAVYLQVFSLLRTLCQHHNPLLSIEAAASLRRMLCSSHELMTRAKTALRATENAAVRPQATSSRSAPSTSLSVSLVPFQRDATAGIAAGSGGERLLLSHAYLWGAHRVALSRVLAGLMPQSTSAAGGSRGDLLLSTGVMRELSNDDALSSKSRALPAVQGGILSDPELWSALPRHPDRFLCRFACAFVEHYQMHMKYDFIAALLPVVRLHAHTAAQLIPLLFLHALMMHENETQRRARQAWSGLIRSHVFENAKLVPSVARSFLRALDVVRCAMTSIIKKNGLRRRSAKGHENTVKVKTAAGMVPGVESFLDVWWLSDISALDLAKAAEQCEMWDACILYLELSCESLLKKPGLVALHTGALLSSAAIVPQRPADPNRPVTRDAARQAEALATIESHRSAIMDISMHVGRALCDADWMDGCSRNVPLDAEKYIVRCQAQGNWVDALRQADSLMGVQKSARDGGAPPSLVFGAPLIAQSLIQLGCPRASGIYASSILDQEQHRRSTQNGVIRSALAEAAWRAGQWDTDADGVASKLSRRDGNISIHEAIFSALRACQNKDLLSYRIAMRSGRAELLSKMCGGYHAIKDAIALSEAFHQISKAVDASNLLGVSGGATMTPRVAAAPLSRHRLDVTDALALDETLPFDRMDVVDSVRLSLCQLPNHVDYHRWSQLLIPAVERALQNGAVSSASRNLDAFQLAVQYQAPESMKRLMRLPSIVHCRAKLFAQQGEPSLGIRLLQDVIENIHKGVKDGARSKLPPDIVRSIVWWAHDAQLVPTTSLIRDEGFHEIVSVQEAGGRSSFAMAQLCDHVLTELQSRWDSAETQSIRRSLAESTQQRNDLKRQMEEVQRRVETLKSTPASTKQQQDLQREQEVFKVLRMRIDNIRKELEHHTSQHHKMIQDWSVYRNTAIFHYAKSLNELGMGTHKGPDDRQHGTSQYTPMSLEETQSLRVQAMFRTAGLWLSPPASVADVVVAEQDHSSISMIPTECFLPLYTQLAARASSATGLHAKTLTEILTKVATDFPYHTLWHLMALANGHRWSPSEQASHATDTDKIQAARNIISALKKKSPALGPIVKSVEQLADAYLELAFETPSSTSKQQTTFPIKPQSKLLRHVADFQRIPVPTTNLPVDATIAGRGYKLDNDVPTVLEFRAHYETAGGINLPKVLCCVSSQGTVEKQLLKSNDDMRQDAIIEQFFGVVNTLLSRRQQRTVSPAGSPNVGSNYSRLLIRRYQVVPLAPSSGVLQWVPNTMPLGQYLIDAHDGLELGAHTRYFPNDISFSECRQRLDSKTVSKSEQRLLEYQKITAQFSPAMHYFFLEHFASAEEWFERRRVFSSSVACASMVGHLVGLGDRHLSNILLDIKTAEVVLIDLGIAFDQGKLLRLPELVPFRLTRDMVDGLGMHGVEGAFRNICESTLRITREHRDLLSTVLDAFIHDPLAKWAVDTNNNGAAAAAGNNGGADAQGDATTLRAPKAMTKQSTADADRALARVREKLQGYEGGEVFSVQGQVQRLIKMATSEENLSAMYEGWAAWV